MGPSPAPAVVPRVLGAIGAPWPQSFHGVPWGIQHRASLPSSDPGEQPRDTAQPRLEGPSRGQLCQGLGLRVPWGELRRLQSPASEAGGAGEGQEQEEQLKMEQQKLKEPRGLVCTPWPRCSKSYMGWLRGLVGMVVGPAAPAHSPPRGCPWGWEAASPSPYILHGPSQGRGTQDPSMGSGMGSPRERCPPSHRELGGVIRAGRTGQGRGAQLSPLPLVGPMSAPPTDLE